MRRSPGCLLRIVNWIVKKSAIRIFLNILYHFIYFAVKANNWRGKCHANPRCTPVQRYLLRRLARRWCEGATSWCLCWGGGMGPGVFGANVRIRYTFLALIPSGSFEFELPYIVIQSRLAQHGVRYIALHEWELPAPCSLRKLSMKHPKSQK